MNLIDSQIFDVHLTTLATYLGAFIILLFYGRKKGFNKREQFFSTIGVMIPAVLSFETIWIPLNSLMTHTRFYGVSSLVINLTIIGFSLGIANNLWNGVTIDSISTTLITGTIVLWLWWLPTFAVDNVSRLHADPIKIFQTASLVYPFVKR